ncbi:hypothetical protein MKZ38_007830 [Zalerion maritima]|uniref:Centromere protein H C-terminal domain-containing protein n=1 Tax=Zalerion maritima TaxID=339359 RepID=A0AAD5RLV5_9PEZI|nr:hypothetical protein MKZ38_007830 [Zalerion maritima]
MDVEMSNTNGNQNSKAGKSILRLSKDENLILALWDQLQQLQMGIAALKAERDTTTPPTHPDPDDEELSKARDESMTARATYEVHRSVVDAVLVANPILKAVHAGDNASPIERDLLPHLQKRDQISSSISTQTETLNLTLDQVSKTEREVLLTTRNNLALTETLLGLVDDIDRTTKEKVEGRRNVEEVQRLEVELAETKKRWTVMKATASAIVAGSGVDWVRDPELRDVVLDPEAE